ncbi:MAG: hypothetical protein JJE05_05130 [Actinobacteria bacterium]|nr:hypothetical protein [Actinomycetota bacterium]
MTSARLRKAVASGAVLALIVAVPTQAASKTKRARIAARFVASQQAADGSIVTFSVVGSTADAVMSFVAVGRGKGAIQEAIGFLRDEVKAGNVIGVGVASKVLMAAYAAGKDPTGFGAHDLVAQIENAEQLDGRFGDTEFSYVYDQALALLALEAAGIDPSAEAVAWLEEAQCGDGGWQFDQPSGPNDDGECFDEASGSDFNSSDSNTTALAVQALEVSEGTEMVVSDAFGYLEALRDSEYGGWGYTATFPTTDANSTSLVIQAYAAAERLKPQGSMGALISLQHRLCGKKGGAFGFTFDGKKKTPPDAGATIAGMVGLLKKPFPIRPRTVTKPAPKPKQCR